MLDAGTVRKKQLHDSLPHWSAENNQIGIHWRQPPPRRHVVTLWSIWSVYGLPSFGLDQCWSTSGWNCGRDDSAETRPTSFTGSDAESIFWDIILHLPSLLERTKGLSQCGQETEEYLGALNSRSAQKKNKTGRVSNQEIKSSLGELTTLARLSWIYRHWWRFTFSTCLHSILHLHL